MKSNLVPANVFIKYRMITRYDICIKSVTSWMNVISITLWEKN